MRDVVRQRLEKEIKGAIGRLGEDGAEIVDPDEIVTPVPDERRPSAEAKRKVVERMIVSEAVKAAKLRRRKK